MHECSRDVCLRKVAKLSKAHFLMDGNTIPDCLRQLTILILF